jgi:anti-sigma regulatory factor (Ser/Thr protein kinase)
VLRAAAEEIEDYHRSDALEVPPVAVSAAATGDVIHLLAELLENAANFSPPHTVVRVSARPTMEGMTITVYDEGIGMPPAKLAEANQRLAQPSALTSSLVGTMGLLVVARLAERHHILVVLHSTPGSGTAATVTVPDHILASAPPDSLTFRALGVLPALPEPVVESTVVMPPVPVRLDGTAPELPRRGTGMPVRTHGADTGSNAPPGALDPETVRARLSSLASGIAAAQRRSATSPSPNSAPPAKATTS